MHRQDPFADDESASSSSSSSSSTANNTALLSPPPPPPNPRRIVGDDRRRSVMMNVDRDEATEDAQPPRRAPLATMANGSSVKVRFNPAARPSPASFTAFIQQSASTSQAAAAAAPAAVASNEYGSIQALRMSGLGQQYGTVPPETQTSRVNVPRFAIRPSATAHTEPSIQDLNLHDLLIPSNIMGTDTQKLYHAILEEFNRGIPRGVSFATTSVVRGKRLNPGEYLLGQRNKVAELVAFNPAYNIAVEIVIDPTVEVKEIEVVNQAQTFFGAHGKFVLNVPIDKFAKAISGNTPKLYGPGIHVIHDVNFKFDVTTGLVNQATAYIQHGNIHILRVPAGKIAKVWIGNEPKLLVSRVEPYVFDSVFFRLEAANDTDYFFDATLPLIKHGSIKRVMPHTGTVAISFNNGKLEIIEPKTDDNEQPVPTIIISPNHDVEPEFLNTSLQTFEFPSETMRNQKRANDARATDDEINYIQCTTSDSQRIGIKILVTFKINNPKKALEELRTIEKLLHHIESVSVVDMARVVSRSTSNDLTRSFQNKALHTALHSNDAPSAPPLQSIQDEIKAALGADLSELGITLHRFNMESPKFMNQALAEEMAKQSLTTAATAAQAGVLEQQFDIAKRKAEQEAEVKRVALSQTNDAITLQAEAERKAAVARAEAKLTEADADAKAMLIRAQAQSEIQRQQGELFHKYPELFQLEMAKRGAEALAKTTFHVTSPEFYRFASPYNLFGNTSAGARDSLNLPSGAALIEHSASTTDKNSQATSSSSSTTSDKTPTLTERRQNP